MGIEGIKAIRLLSREGIKTNATLVFTVAQALLALKAGANYVSLFTGPYASMSDAPVSLTKEVKQIIENYNFMTKIIDCVRSPLQTVEAAMAGADICTMDYPYLKLLFENPMTALYLNKFKEAWDKIYKGQTWLS